ncbi:hypothetical protein EDC01DRAFT_787771 [Geopyxis carbonaria]|nr:hypothetical protein EDC01DRAFT_787771 [Geopyxis carbonaria]
MKMPTALAPPSPLELLPPELLLEILDHLPRPSTLSLRATSRHFSTLFAHHLDSKLFSTLHLRHTSTSYAALAALAAHPVLSRHVTTLVHATTRLRPLPDAPTFAAALRDRARALPQPSRFPTDDADVLAELHAEYQKIVAEQHRILARAPAALTAAFTTLPALRSIVLANESTAPVRGRHFDAGALPQLRDEPLDAFADAQPCVIPAALRTARSVRTPLSTHTFCTLLAAAARSGRVITRVEVRSSAGILGKVVGAQWDLEELATGLAGVQELLLAVDARGGGGNTQLYPAPEFHVGDVTAELLAKATQVRKLRLFFHGPGLGLVRCMNLRELVPANVMSGLEEVALHYLEVKATDLVRFLRAHAKTLQRLTIGNVLLIAGGGGWSFVMGELKGMVGKGFELRITSSLAEEREERSVFVSPSKASKMMGGEEDAYVESY